MKIVTQLFENHVLTRPSAVGEKLGTSSMGGWASGAAGGSASGAWIGAAGSWTSNAATTTAPCSATLENECQNATQKVYWHPDRL